MLAEERFNRILNIVEEKKSVTVTELTELLDTSESTIRRDLNALDANGQLTKVHGGAILKTMAYSTKDDNVVSRKEKNRDAKNKIAKYAAEQIAPGDFVYLDAGNPKYTGIGRLMIALGIKLSIDNGFAGDVILEAKTTALAKHYEKDFGAILLPTFQSSAPRYLIADDAAKQIFLTYLSE